MGAFNLSDWAIRHRSLVWFFLIVIVAAGVLSYTRLGRNEDPAFTIKTMVVQAAWPGASIDETLAQITDRIEKKLQETPYLDFIRSYTVAGQTTVFVNLKGSTPAREVANVWYQVRKKIGDIRGSFPQGIVGPGFNDEFGDTYGIIYAFTAEGFTQRDLRDRVEAVRSTLLQVEDVSKIDIFGTQDERIYIEFSVQHMAGLGIDRQALVRALQAQNAIAPAGVVQTADEKIMVRVSGAFQSEEDLRKVNFVAGGRLFRLSDIATVTRAYADPPQPMFRINGQSAIGIAIAMRDGGDILSLGKNIEAAMAKLTAELPVGIEPRLVAEQPAVVNEAVHEFMKALWEAIAIVLAVSFISLGMRAGAVVAASIPLVLAMVFVAMEIFRIDLQRVSLGALIIALGLLVDDAMITVETMVTKLEEGWTKARAATFAYTSTAFPMLTGTLVTVAGFVPIGFARSAAGEYTFSLFAVVGIALIASWFVAVIFAPLIGVTILSDKRQHAHAAEPGRVMRVFRRVLVGAMRMRWVTIAATLALFALSLFGMRFVPQQFFPSSDRPELLVDLKLAQNASIYATGDAAGKLDGLLRDDKDIDRWSTYIGRGAVRFYLPLNVQLPNDFFAQAVIVTKSLEARERVRARLEAALPEALPNVVVRISALEMGPPVGWPVQYRVSGPDAAQVREIAFRVAQAMAENRNVDKVNFDWIEPARTLRMRVDQDQARLLGISSEQLAQALNTVVSGITITQLRDGIYLIDVVARAAPEDRISASTLRTLQIPLANGRTVPLMQIASVDYGQELPLIWRRDRLPTLTVQGDVIGNVQPATVVQALQGRIDELNRTLPDRYRIALGGTVEESTQSQASVAAVVPLMLLLMMAILMIQLQSFQRLFLVLSVAPLGLIGVVAALLLAGKPLGFVAILGVIALIGMIVRNSVILVDQIETEIAHGRSRWDAVVEATLHRFRPILLTAAAAILGMIPIAPTVFWGPMAYAIMGGLAVATALTLVFLPALYVAWFRVKEREEERAREPAPASA
ncbi:MAG TPA: efflux RND transporter permease subunit [Xanthobacteraceae bacterium]